MSTLMNHELITVVKLCKSDVTINVNIAIVQYQPTVRKHTCGIEYQINVESKFEPKLIMTEYI